MSVNHKFVHLLCLIILPFFQQCTGDHAKDASGSKRDAKMTDVPSRSGLLATALSRGMVNLRFIWVRLPLLVMMRPRWLKPAGRRLHPFKKTNIWDDKESVWQTGKSLVRNFAIDFANITFGHEWKIFRNINLLSDEKHQQVPEFSFTRTFSLCSRSVQGRYKRNWLRLLSAGGNKVNW